MRLFGFGDPKSINVEQLKLFPSSARIGEKVNLKFNLMVGGVAETLVRLEYVVDYIKASGKTSQKVFQISEKSYSPGSHTIKKRHNFADMSTRKHYPGVHQISIIVNGIEKARSEIKLSD